MAAQEQEERNREGQREHDLGQIRRYRQRDRRARHDLLRGHPRAPQQRVHQQRGDAEYGDLAEGIEAAEVDQDHVDHVAAEGFRQRSRQHFLADAAGRPGHHRIGQHRHADTGRQRDRDVAPAPERLPFRRRAERQVVHAQQQQRQAHHLDQQLGQGQIRRRQEHEGQAHRQSGATQQDQHDQALPVPAQRGDRTGRQQQPEDPAQRRHRLRRAPFDRGVAGQERRQPDRDRGQHQPAQAALQAAVGDAPGQPLRQREQRIDVEQENPPPQ